MKAGQSKIFNVGQKIKLVNVKDDKELNGMTGKATHPFAFGETKKGWIGVYLDDTTGIYGDKVNIHESECEIID